MTVSVSTGLTPPPLVGLLRVLKSSTAFGSLGTTSDVSGLGMAMLNPP